MSPQLTVTRSDPRTAIKAYEAELNPALRGRIYQREFKEILDGGGFLPIQAANAPGTLMANVVTQRVLELLKLHLPELGRITTDFSTDSVRYGQAVLSRYVSIPTVGTYNAGTGYPAADQTATDVSVTINQHKCVQATFTANDLSGTSRRLFDEFAPACAYAMGKDLIDYAYALILIATFTNATTKALASFTRSDVIDMGSAMNGRGVPQGSAYRTLLLNSSYFAGLAKDSTIVTLAAYQQPDIITEGNLPNVHGFSVIEAPNLPATGNMTGFGMSRSALVAATRLPGDYASVLPGASYGSVETVVNPDTGAACVQTSYVDHKLGTANFRLAWMYGAAVGQPNAGQILKSV